MRRFFVWLKQPEWVFLIVALLFGGVMVFYIPNQSGFDELDHLAPIWEISDGYFIPNQLLSKGPKLPAAFLHLSYRNQFFYDPVDPKFFTTHANERIDYNNLLNYKTRSSYLPTVYLPQALVVRELGRKYNEPVLLIFYICRALYLLGYIILTFFAIRLIPFGKWLLLVLALAPIALYQASTVSPDSYTNGACFLFVAWVVKLACQEKRINWKQFWITIGITALLLMVKLNAVFLLPLLLLLVWTGFESKKMLPILAGTVVCLFLIFVVGWNVLIYPTFYLNTPGYGAFGQLTYIFSHFLDFGTNVFHDMGVNGIGYLRDWVATYGFGAWHVPPAIYPLFGLILAAAWFFSPSPQPINTRIRVVLILTGLVASFLMMLVIYLTLNPIGSSTIGGLQGRHFTPLAPVILLGLAPGKKFFSRLADWVIPVVIGVGTVLALCVYLFGIYLSYYVVCGNSIYGSGLCYQPQYKNWAPNAQFTQPVTQGVTLQQTFTGVCTPIQLVRVWSESPSQTGNSETTIILKNVSSGAVLEKRVENQNATDHGWLEVAFPAIDNAIGQDFMIEITSGVTQPVTGLSFGVTTRREYLSGLVINDVPKAYDLIFQYGCAPLKLIDVIDHKKP
jgi:uncharacterized membrane protein